LTVLQHDKILRRGVLSTSAFPQPEGPPLVGCPRLLIQYIRCYPPHCRPFLYPQPKDAPCRGDRDPLFTVELSISYRKPNVKLRGFHLGGISCSNLPRGEFRPRQTRQLPRAVDLKGRLLSYQSY